MKKIKKIGSALLAVIIMLTYALFLENTKPKFKARQVLQSSTPTVIDGENVLGVKDETSDDTWNHYFLESSDQFFSGGPGKSGLKIAEGAKVVIDLCGHKLYATGGDAPAASTTQEGGIGGGAGIWVPESSTLVFVGQGQVIAKGGKGGNGNKGSNGNGVSFDSYGSGYYYANPNNINSGQGGAGGGGGGGAGAGIGTPGGKGGKGGAQTDRLSIERWAKSTVQYTNLLYNNGEPGGNADQEMGNLYVLGQIQVNAIGGDAGESGGAGGVTSGHNVAVYTRIDSTLYNSDWTEVSASVGSGGAGGGAGCKGAPIGTGGGGGGGGASGYSGGTTCCCPINNTHPNNIVSNAAARAWIVQSLVADGMGKGPNMDKNGTMNSHNAISQPIYGYRSIGGSSSDWSYGGEYYGTNPIEYYTYSEGGDPGKEKVKKKVIITAPESNVLENDTFQLPFTDYVTVEKLSGEGYEVDVKLYSDNTDSDLITATATIGNTALTLPTNTTVHTREGYTLQGYYTRKADGNYGDQVLQVDESGNLSTVVNATVLDDSNPDYVLYPVVDGLWNTVYPNSLYAQWTANKYNVTLNPNGGSGSNTVKTVTYDQQPDKFTTHSRDGYTLTGYYTATTNGTKIIDSNGSLVKNVPGYTDGAGNWKKAADTTLYAQWTENIAGTQTISIKATHVPTKIQEVVSVDVSWGNMEFTYTPLIWNSVILQYVENDNGWSANGNNITLTNHSNVDVRADFVFESNENFSGVTGSYVSNSNNNNEVVNNSVEIPSAFGTELDEAPKRIVDLAISGNASNSGTLGHTKVTIAKSAVQS